MQEYSIENLYKDLGQKKIKNELLPFRFIKKHAIEHAEENYFNILNQVMRISPEPEKPSFEEVLNENQPRANSNLVIKKGEIVYAKKILKIPENLSKKKALRQQNKIRIKSSYIKTKNSRKSEDNHCTPLSQEEFSDSSQQNVIERLRILKKRDLKIEEKQKTQVNGKNSKYLKGKSSSLLLQTKQVSQPLVKTSKSILIPRIQNEKLKKNMQLQVRVLDQQKPKSCKKRSRTYCKKKYDSQLASHASYKKYSQYKISAAENSDFLKSFKTLKSDSHIITSISQNFCKYPQKSNLKKKNIDLMNKNLNQKKKCIIKISRKLNSINFQQLIQEL